MAKAVVLATKGRTLSVISSQQNVEGERKRKSSKNKKKGGNGQQNRFLLKAGNLRPHFAFTGNMQRSVIRGFEVIDEIRTSVEAVTHQVTVNPTLAQSFPRLSGFAQMFEMYRFRMLRISYTTGAPATRSGAVAIGVRTTYGSEFTANNIPVFMPEFAAYEYSAVGSIAENLSAPQWRSADPEYFFTGAFGLPNQVNTNSLKRNQAQLMYMTRDSVSADAGLLAGYIGIEYEVELVNLRPALQKVFGKLDDLTSGAPSAFPSQTIDSTHSAKPNLKDPTVEQGAWFTTTLRDAIQSGTDISTVWNDLKTGLQYYAALRAAVGAPAAEEKDSDEEFKIVRKKPQPIHQWEASHPRWSEGTNADKVISWEREAFWEHVDEFKDPEGILTPLATNDVALTLYSQYPGEGSATLLSTTVVTLAGAADMSITARFTIPSPSLSGNFGELAASPAVWCEATSGGATRTVQYKAVSIVPSFAGA